MRSADGDDLPLAYWLGLTRRNWQYHIVKRHHLAAFLRCLWRTVAHRDNIESCMECGRRYASWVANDVLYEEVHGSRGGQYCHECFTVKARQAGRRLRWTPMVVTSENQKALHNYVGGFADPGYRGPRCPFVTGDESV